MKVLKLSVFLMLLLGCEDSERCDEPISRDSHRITAADGTELVFTVFRPANVCGANPAPLLLWNHGYPEFRTDELDDALPYLERGYGFISLDQRGILGESGGITSGAARPGIEDVDASQVLDWVYDNLDWALRQPDSGVAKDLAVGTFGNGGGGHLSLLVAASDPRIDAVVPYVAYSSVLDDVFIPNEAPRAFWANLFLDFSITLGVRFDPALLPSIESAGDTLVVDDRLREVWRESDIEVVASNIRAPTMFLQPLPDQITSGLRSAIRSHQAIATDPSERWLVGLNAPFLDVGDARGFGVGAPDRERPNQCADIYTPGFQESGLGRFLDGQLVFLFFDAFVRKDPAARARMDRVPHVLLPVEQEGCVRAEAWPVVNELREFRLGAVSIPQDESAVTFPLFEATEPTLIAGAVELSATIPEGQDELFVGSLVIASGDRAYVVNDQVHGAQTGRFSGRLDVELGTVVTRLEAGDTLQFVLQGEHFIYARAGGEISDAASLDDLVVGVPVADVRLVGEAESTD
ncbi:MAG: CocE/NonD family hydrolase [Myxococcota bacterium]